MSDYKKDDFTRDWIIENSINICSRYEYGILTLRALHYQLVGLGMTNSTRHYKRVVSAMIKARRENIVSYYQFSDHDREVLGDADYYPVDLNDSIETGKQQVRAWMENFSRNRWENQSIIPEVWIEKKALQGVFASVCRKYKVALAPCKGYPSLTFLNDAADRFRGVYEKDQTPIILYFGDYDATGEDIPRSIQDNLYNDFLVDVEVRRISLLEKQVIDMRLPPAPTKETDSRAAAWDGIGQVELDAVDPDVLQDMCKNAILDVFDDEVFDDLKEEEKTQRKEYKSALKAYVKSL